MTATQQKRKAPTAREIVAQQKADAARDLAQRAAMVPAVPDTRTSVEKYIDEIAPSSMAGQVVKFSKDGKFIVRETGDELGPDDEFVALCDGTLAGWIRFYGEGMQPERYQGLIYQGFEKPAREDLGDLDPAEWPAGLDGRPKDPWQHQMCLVLRSTTTAALYTFVTTSLTGRRAVGALLQHFNRLRRMDGAAYPIVRLQASGFKSKKPGVGWVPTPCFAIVGSTSKEPPPNTSAAADINDEVPFLG